MVLVQGGLACSECISGLPSNGNSEDVDSTLATNGNHLISHHQKPPRRHPRITVSKKATIPYLLKRSYTIRHV